MNQIKKLLILTSLLISGSLWAEDKSFTFGVSCKIIDQEIMAMEEGESKRYAGYKGKPQIGEYFYLKFEIEDAMVTPNFHIHVEVGEDENKFTSFSFPHSSYEERITYTYSFRNSDPLFTDSASFSSYLIKLDSDMPIESDASLSMRRYYKDDWNFSFNRRHQGEVQILHANCMNMPDDYNLLLSRLEERHGKRD